jgi:O-antigen/teichoic acid export membrane protein
MSAPTTERRFLSSTVAAYGSQLGRVLIRAGSDLLLARLILPQSHGLFDLALSVVTIAAIFRDLGLPYQVIRDQRRPYGSVLLWVVGAGLLLWGLLAAGAPLAAGLDPGLPAVLRVYALWVFLDGLSVVPKLFFERELEVGRLVAPEIARGLAVALVSIALAWRGAGVWSLVAGELAGAALFAAFLWWRAWGRMRLELDPRLIRPLITSSIYLFFIALMALPMPAFAKFILAGYSSAAMVGQFTKARDWAFRLQVLVLPAVARVLYPALVEYRHGDRARFLSAYRLGTVTILAFETLAAYLLFFNAETILLHVLLGPRWRPAVGLLRILCFVPLTDPFSRLGGEVLKAEGEDRGWLAIVALNFVSLLGLGILLTRALGAPGIAWAHFFLAGNLLMAWRIWRICGAEFWRLARDLAFLYLVPLPLFLAAAWALPEGWGRLAASLAAGAVAGLLYLLRFRRPLADLFTSPLPQISEIPAAAEVAP